MKRILIATHQRGFEADPVIDLLVERDVPFFRFNFDDGPPASTGSFNLWNNLCSLECDGRELGDYDIAAGWCQQLPPYLDQPSSDLECLQRCNLWPLQLSILNQLPINWLNSPSAVLHGGNKIRQLSLAHQLGLVIPETIVSNQPDHIRAFAAGRQLIAKNLATPWLIEGDDTNAAYTKLVDPTWLEDDEALSFCPIIYQVFHHRKWDYRVVIVGDSCFSARAAALPGQEADIRVGTPTGEHYELCSFDPEILIQLKRLMQRMSLQYCAADFMEDENGVIRFLEVNTCGAWWWLDNMFDGQICTTIANQLQQLTST